MKLTAIFAVAFAAAAIGQDSTPADKVPPYELKNRSSFSVSPDERAPFWPIGWVRPKVEPGQPVPEQPQQRQPVQPALEPLRKLEPGAFNITSVLLGNPALAMINGRSFAEGEQLPVFDGDERLNVIVRKVHDGGVWLQLDKQQPVYVPLRRGETLQRPASPEVPASQQEWRIRVSGK